MKLETFDEWDAAEKQRKTEQLAVNFHQRLVDALRNLTFAFNSTRLTMDKRSRDIAGEIVEENRALLVEIAKEAHRLR